MKSDLFSIPPVFYSFDTKSVFTHCLVCEGLLNDDCDYMIEKAFRQYNGYTAIDVIFECAICMDCAIALQAGLSESSKRSIHGFINGHFNSEKRIKKILAIEKPEELMESCLINEKSKKDCEYYQVFALCKGNHLNMQMPPYMICDEALEEMHGLLSEKSKEDLGGFFKKHFAPDPDLFKNDLKLLLI
jgi:hypothetical protein